MAKVRKAVIAAAGFGTRFLPQTKAMPKEMLPIVDKPVIQYIVEELVAAGIEDIIIVTGYHKRTIEDHFDQPSTDLLQNLEQGGKDDLIAQTKAIGDIANFVYVRQKGVYGNATPLHNVAHLIGDEPFIYVFADDIMIAQPNCYTQLINVYKETGASVIPCIELTKDSEYASYGVVGGEQTKPGLIKMSSIIEKPGREKAPSNFGAVGGYLFTPDVLNYVDAGLAGLKSGQEFYVSDSVIQPMLSDGKDFYGCLVKNLKRYDAGSKIDYLKTVVDVALQREDIKEEFLAYLQGVVKE